MMLKSYIVAGLAALAYGQGTPDLAGALSANPNLSQLATLVNSQPALVQALSSARNITILAPSNAALANLLNTTAGQSLATNPGAVAALLSYHVLNGTYFGSQITNSSTFVRTLLTNTTYANVTGGQRVEAVTVNGNVTFFSGLRANSTVVQANQNFTGGTIHVINTVLSIPRNVSTTLIQSGLSSLYGALNASNLLAPLNGLSDVTIFAPNNSAFQAIGSALPNLTAQQVASILSYHVVNGTRPYYSTNLNNGTSLQTLNGANVTIHKSSSGSTFVNGAKVVLPNVLIAGGVVHVIDQVLNPQNATATVGDNAPSGAPAFSGASSVSNAPFTSGVAAPTTSVGGSPSSSSSRAVGVPMQTGAIGAAALFGAGAVFLNL